MIEKLTKEQISRFDEFKNKWLEIGLSTEPSNHALAEDAVIRCYKTASLKPPEEIIWVDSPRAGVLTILKAQQVKEITEEKISDILRNSFHSQYDAGYLAFIDFFRIVCGLTSQTEKNIPMRDLAYHSNWNFLFEKTAFLCEKPMLIKLNAQKRIHCEDGPSICYRDGFSVYGLNGVRVPKWVVMKKPDEFQATEILKEKNAEVRREIVRKIGITRFCEIVNAQVIDKKDDYELLNVDLGDGRRRPYLKMINPSIGTIHIEGVAPECKTVTEALAWRNHLKVYEKPKILT